MESKTTDSKPCFWTTDRIMRLIIGICLAAIVVWLVDTLRDALLPFFVACLIAYLLQPIVEFNRRWTHEKGRVWSAILTVVEVSAVIALLMYLLLPIIVREFDALDHTISEVTSGRIALSPEIASIIDFFENHLKLSDIKESLSNMQVEALISRGSTILSESIEVISGVIDLVLTFVYILFILIDYPQITRGFTMIVPYKYRGGAISVLKDVQVSMNHYFRGQGMVALFATIFYCVGFSIIDLPLAIPMGLLVGILYMIPYFQYVTLIPVALICFVSSLSGDVSFFSLFGKSILVYVITQPVCDYIITPRIMGRELGLNAAVILLSLSIWGTLLGIIGMIIALPVTSLLMSYYEQYISNPRESREKFKKELKVVDDGEVCVDPKDKE